MPPVSLFYSSKWKVVRQIHGEHARGDLLTFKRHHVAHGAAPLVEDAARHGAELPIVFGKTQPDQLILGDGQAFRGNNQELERRANGVAARSAVDIPFTSF